MERPLPNYIEAEEAVLGSLIQDPEAIAEVLHLVQPGDFYRDLHRDIYQAILDLFHEHGPADLITLCSELQRRDPDQYEKMDGQAYIATLLNTVPTSANAAYYAKIVERAARGRRLIHAAGKIAALGYTQDDEMMEKAFRLVIEAGARREQGQELDIAEVLEELYEDIERRSKEGMSDYVLYTGIPAIDEAMGGMERKELIYVAARPGTGKSVFGLEVATNVARQLRDQGKPGTVFYYNLEMSRHQQMRRLIASKTHLNSQMIRAGFKDKRGQFFEEEFNTFIQKLGELGSLLKGRLKIYDKPISVDDLYARLSIAKMTKHCRFVVIDQLDLVVDHEHDREHDSISHTSKRLKQIALELDITILALVQLNREVENRPGLVGKRPILPDLRYSGRLEQDADQVWFLFRPCLYPPALSHVPHYEQYAEAIAGKMREGPRGIIVPFCYWDEFTAIEPWPREWGRPILDEKEGK